MIAEPTVTIDMFLDVSCPWCHGALTTNRRVLDELAADANVPHLDVRWRFMRLHPMPAEGGIALDAYYASWGDGSPEAIERARDDVRAYVASVGVRVDFDRYTYMHDPFTAHRLLAIVRDDAGTDLPDMWSLARAVWNANFVDGRDITDHAELRAGVAAAGLQLPARVWERLADPSAHRDATLADHASALSVHLDGVPRMVVGDTIVPTWIDPADVRERLRAAIGSIATIA